MIAGLSAAAFARADSNLLVGFADDTVKWQPAALRDGRSLGARMYRVTIRWTPGQQSIAPSDAAALARLLGAGSGARVVVSVYGSANAAPVGDAAETQYCGFVATLLRSYPAINDVVIWNEPNKSAFWQLQFGPDGTPASPAAYEALLARCWDTLHAVRPTVNVIAPATSSTGNDNPAAPSPSLSPGAFIRGMGSTYSASGRRRPIFDTVAHHPYGKTSAEPPWTAHTDGTIGEGDWQQLMSAYFDAFARTSQPIPGEQGVEIWYLEDGFETGVGTQSPAYSGVERSPSVLSFADQASQIANAVALAYCQPYVGAFLNFELWDDPSLAGWQSAPCYADGTPKPSAPAFQRAFLQANAHAINCSSLPFSVPATYVAAPLNLAAPAIVGAATPGSVVSATPGVWNGATQVTLRWRRCSANGARCQTILGAAGSSYRVRTPDVGAELTVVAVATNGSGSSTALSLPVPVTVVSS